MEDVALEISLILNVALAVLSVVLGRRGLTLLRKIRHLHALVKEFIQAYEDKVITREEARKLLERVERLITDP